MTGIRFHIILFVSILSNAALGAEHSAAAAPTFERTLIEGVPHIVQKPDFCGEACAAMYLQALGETVDQDYVFDASGTEPALGRGAYAAELNRALISIGFDTGTVWNPVFSSADMDRQFALLHADLLRGTPSIVCMHYSDQPVTTEHFRLILGYDPQSDEVIYHEPAEANGAYRRMKRSLFQKLWPLGGKNEQIVVRMRLLPGALAYGEIAAERTAADFAQHVLQLKKKVPPGFTLVVEPPFVVIGDEDPETVYDRAATTVRWTVELLKKDFFAKDPTEILDIWLFKDDASYRKHALQLFGDRPATPYGYYSEQHRSLVMNIATGGGTLVHEIVHPFMAANFPNCPAWFNEGMGSLYEACMDNDGHIRGVPNWRLSGLKTSIQAGTLPSFQALTATTDTEFYGRDPGTNYAQARYLLYYLQENGLLLSYYHQFLANRSQDPSGYQTLQKILGKSDMSAFQTRWEAWTLQLGAP